jgi:hypothetical protein
MTGLTATSDVNRIEAPVTVKAYRMSVSFDCAVVMLYSCQSLVMCAFAAFGGIFFGYDSG